MTRRPEIRDTIVAIATPPGRGALGTVRFSGPDTRRLAACLFRPWRRVEPFPPQRQAVSGTAIVPMDEGWQQTGAAGPTAAERPPAAAAAGRSSGPGDPHSSVARPGTGGSGSPPGEAIDHGVLIHFPAENSPTGEDLVEITLHGSPLVLQRLLEAAVRCGARLALPGEFSYRAFLNGRMDAIQAEAIDDLVRARTAQQARAAHRQQSGALSRAVAGPREELVSCLARLEGSLEFSATETEDFLDREALSRSLAGVRAAIGRLLDGAGRGLRLRSGARVVLAGPVNAGKSSILNMLCESSRAIVHPSPGTTRDVIEADVEWAGVPVTLVDTAGERHDARPGTTAARGSVTGANRDVPPATPPVPGAGGGPDPVEIEGQRRGAAERSEADLVVWVTEVGRRVPPPALPPGAPPHLLVVNKIDLEPVGPRAPSRPENPRSRKTEVGPRAHPPKLAGSEDRRSGRKEPPDDDQTMELGSGGREEANRWYRVSALTGEGLDGLRAAALERLAPGASGAEPPLVTRLRQKSCLERAAAALDDATALVASGAGEELVVIPLGKALEELAELTGRGDLDDIYDRIFSTFCIGK